jgi:uncharacterized DUF497 family protein
MFEWDEFNLSHVQRHGLEPADVEEAASDPRRLGVPASNSGGEPCLAPRRLVASWSS